MPRLKPATQAAKREHILDAAERCFAAAGFHGTSMQDICKEAQVSAGAIYVYFSSKEELIAGITERDRAKFASQLAEVAAAPDLITALAKLGEHYTVVEPQYKRVLTLEIGAEATRNPAVGKTFRSVDDFCLQQLEQLFRKAAAEGRIAPTVDPLTLARVAGLIGDGLFWRRAVDPLFDAKTVLPALTQAIASLINPVDASQSATRSKGKEGKS